MEFVVEEGTFVFEMWYSEWNCKAVSTYIAILVDLTCVFAMIIDLVLAFLFPFYDIIFPYHVVD